MPVSVYQIKNKINQKSYIGISINIKKRWKDHTNRKADSVISRAIKKYGKENFDYIILEKVDNWETACEREIYLIKELKTKSPNGYNLTDGGDGVCGVPSSKKGKTGIYSQETINKISTSLKEYYMNNDNPFLGKHHTEESKKKISESCKNAMTEERKKEISEFHKGKVPWMKGKHHTEESKKKSSLANKGRTAWNKGKKDVHAGEKNPFFGKYHTQETKDKIANIHKGNKYNLGRVFSNEHKKKLSKAKLKLSIEQALEVKELLKKNNSMDSIARLFGVSNTVIKNIKIGKTYHNI